MIEVNKVSFTRREKEISKLIGSGLTAPRIATLFDRSTETVKNHMYHIRQKLGAVSTSEALTIMFDYGHLSPNCFENNFDLASIVHLTQREWEAMQVTANYPEVRRDGLGELLNPPVRESEFKNKLTNVNKKLKTKNRKDLLLFNLSLMRPQDFHVEFNIYDHNPLEDQNGITPQEIEVFRHSPDLAPSYQVQVPQE